MKAISGKKFAKVLEKKGWELRRKKGSHHIYAVNDVTVNSKNFDANITGYITNQKGAIKTAEFYGIKLFRLRGLNQIEAEKAFPYFNFKELNNDLFWIVDQNGKMLLVGAGNLTEKLRDK